MRRYVARCYCNNCNSLFTCFLSHQVSIFTHTYSVHFSAFFMHYPYCTTLPVRTRNCSLLQRHFRDVTLTPPRMTDITLSRMTRAGSHFVPRIRYPFPMKKVRRQKRSNIFGPYITYGLFQTKREIRAKFGSGWFRNVNLYKVQTNQLSASCILYKILRRRFSMSLFWSQIAWNHHPPRFDVGFMGKYIYIYRLQRLLGYLRQFRSLG